MVVEVVDSEPRLFFGLLTKDQVYALVLGQVLSLLITSTGVSSQFLASNFHTSIPVTQGFLNYVLLALFSARLVWHGQLLRTLRERWWRYLLLAVIDVEANYLVVMAYAYTSIGSVMLLDCWTIPVVMFISFFFLRARFRLAQLLGVVLCVLGPVLIVLSDAIHGQPLSAGDSPWLGDVLCIAGATLYGVSNVCQEILVKRHSAEEFLAMLGLFGTAVGAVQMLAVESSQLALVEWSAPVVGLLMAYGAAMFLLYYLTPKMLRLGGATLFNLSLLTSDFFAVIAQTFIFGEAPNWVYGLAFVVIILGLLLFNVDLAALSASIRSCLPCVESPAPLVIDDVEEQPQDEEQTTRCIDGSDTFLLSS